MLKLIVIFKTLKNHFKFQNALNIVFGLRNEKEIIKLKNNKNIFLRKNSKDKETFDEIFLKNIYSIPLPIKPLHIVDAGANTGFASLFFHMKYPKADIVALEIDKENVEMFYKNTNWIPSIEVITKALYNTKSFFKVINPYNASNSFQIVEVNQNESFDIESITIDEILELKNWNEIDILKIDIEGAEKQLFESNFKTWLPKVKIIMIETHDRMIRNCSTVVVNALCNNGFVLYTTTEGTMYFYQEEILKNIK